MKASILRGFAALAFTTMTVVNCFPAAAAAPDAEVEGLQMPAWLIRGGKREPLAIGDQLRNGDQINTGPGSRALLRMGDGSTVKLGENAKFSLDGSERDVVALIEGKITLSRAGQAPITMQEPKTVYLAPRDTPPPPIQQIANDVLAKYAVETEMEPGKGAAGRGGRWRIYAVRTKSQEEALAIYDKLRDAGYPATINPAQADGGTLYRVRITGLLSETDGTTMAIRLKTQLGLEHVAVSLQ